jgi:hypothetical protein
MRKSVLISPALCLALCACSTLERQPAGIAASSPYVRVSNADTNLLELQIAVRKFVPSRRQGPAIWLAGVSHLGQSNYFAALQRELDQKTLVLFEGISERGSGFSPEGMVTGRRRRAVRTVETSSNFVPPSDASQAQGISSLQTSMATSLGLVFQLNAIDYSRPNFRNSDLSVQQLRQLLADQPAPAGEPGASQGFEALLQAMQGGSLLDSLVQLGLRFLSASPKLQALGKLALVEVIGDIKGDPGQLRGLPPQVKQLLEVLVQKRNQKVIDDLSRTLKDLGRADSVAIFYGTGHMPDLELRLRQQLHYRPVEQLWLTAISIDLRRAGVTAGEQAFVHEVVRRQFGPGTKN